MIQKAILFWVLAGMIAIGNLTAETRVKDINTDPYKFTREVVEIKGKVMKRCSDEKEATSKGFIFRDDYGDDIKVVTASDYPEVDQHYRIIGMVIVNATDKEKPEINIIENSREKQYGNLPDNPIYSQQPGQTEKPEPNKIGKGIYILFGLALVLLVVIGILAFFMISNKNRPDFTSDTPPTFPNHLDTSPSMIPEPASYIEDSSIKMTIPPPQGTLKLLPGRLEMISGFDKITEIRFYKLPSTEENEITFGRCTGPNYSHIQFKSPTVSSKQAKMVWMNGKYQLLNYSVTNPTKVNNVELAKDQSMLIEDGSNVEMGEVIFRFHER